MDSNPQQLPHLIVDEQKRSPWAISGIIVLSLMVLAIPLGIFLVSQRTQLEPQAAVSEPAPELSTGIILQSKLSPENKKGIIPVDVYIRSSFDEVNLADVSLKFDPSFLAVDKIATGAAEFKENEVFNKWLEVTTDNNLGNASIIAGLPGPGIKTLPGEGKAYLGTLYLRPKQAGTTVLQIESSSKLYRNSDNKNIFQTGSDLVLQLFGKVEESSPSASPKINSNKPVLVVTNPVGAANYSYFKPIDIIWSAFNVENISQISLLVSGELFGPIAQNLDSDLGKFTWNPQDSLALPYIQSANSFRIEITGEGKNKEQTSSITGPFGIVAQEQVSGAPPNPEVFSVNSLTIDDASRLLSNYLVLPLKENSLDLNKDAVINELDFFLLRQNLIGRGVVK